MSHLNSLNDQEMVYNPTLYKRLRTLGVVLCIVAVILAAGVLFGGAAALVESAGYGIISLVCLFGLITLMIGFVRLGPLATLHRDIYETTRELLNELGYHGSSLKQGQSIEFGGGRLSKLVATKRDQAGDVWEVRCYEPSADGGTGSLAFEAVVMCWRVDQINPARVAYRYTPGNIEYLRKIVALIKVETSFSDESRARAAVKVERSLGAEM